HPTSNNVWGRLYRACANGSWSEKFPSASVSHVQTLCSDHKAIHIKLKSECLFSKGQSKPWRFEAAWLQSPQCEQVVERVWRHPLWTKNLGGISAQLDHCREQLKEEASSIRRELESMAAHEETVWRQRSKDLWLREGDEILGSFTAGLVRDEGIQDCIESYFRKMYASNRPRVSDIAAGIARLRPVVGSSMAVELLSPYTKAEITKALFQMASFKSPGPDGLSSAVLIGHFPSYLDVLEIYRHASGQELNFVKSSVAFSKNTKSEVHRLIADTLQIRMENKMELYLGLPSKVARSKKDLFATSGTESGSVFQGGMQSYYLKGSRKIHWLSWDRLCASKLKGGLGFRQLHLFNIAILAKQLWRILKHPDRLLSKVLRARYFPAGDIFAASLGWPFIHLENLMAALPLFRSDVDGEWARDLQSGLGWILGSLGPIRSSLSLLLHPPRMIKVSDLIDVATGDWGLDHVGIDDILVWYYSSFGLFTVRSAYHLICSLENSPGLSSLFVNEHAWWRFVWQAKVPNKLRCLSGRPASMRSQQVETCSNGCQDPSLFAFIVWALSNIRTHLLLCEPTTILPWMVSVSSAMKLKDRYGHLASSFCFLLLGRSAPGVHKLNFDGALLGGGSAMGLGVVAQNDRGTCLAWLSRRVDRRGTGEVAKALAAWEAIH
ncbi:UNVERIFIED_CONTAM: hypothetical protein Scaly_2910800, partial [Sesamum calycinum]